MGIKGQGGHMKEVYKNIYMKEFPLTGNPLKSINIYAIKTDQGNLIVDTGFNNPENIKNMEDLFEELDLDIKNTSLFLTHLHSDHVGLAKYLEDKGIKEIFLSEVDGHIVENGFNVDGFQWQDIIKHSILQGMEDEKLDINDHPGFKNRPKEYFSYTKVRPGDFIKLGDLTFELIDESGHTPGMLGLYEKDKKILFCGDHILGKITPNITWWGDEYGDSLGTYLKNLEKIKDYHIDHLFSSHRHLIKDVDQRIEELKAHHKKRLEETLSIVKKYGRITTRDVTKNLHWDIRAKSWDDFPPSQKWFAAGEASAHLKYLLARDLVKEEKEDGVYYYSSK